MFKRLLVEKYLLETERLGLRLHVISDIDFMVVLNSDPDVTRFVGGEATSRDRAAEIIHSIRLQFQERQMGRLIVIEKKTAQPIGWCGLKWLTGRQLADVGYRFVKSAWGKGFATEAATECLRYGFLKLNLDIIVAGADPENKASIHVLQKIGMKTVGSRSEDGKTYLDFRIGKAEFIARG